ncbi:MAG: leucine-rich repeat domain-containing protein, partial [Ruminiclostridium sp.]|nr:leucine-rich repeat domain-containing protein [Ruminiclostridium sp.]
MKRKIFAFVTALVSAVSLSLSCSGEDMNYNYNYNDNFGYGDEPNYNEPSWDDYDPAWDMDFGGYLGSFHDRDSGFSAEMYQSGAIVSGYEKSDNHVVIPEKIGDKQVIAINEYAFQGDQSVTDVKLPKSLKYIGRSAFGNCVNLK